MSNRQKHRGYTAAFASNREMKKLTHIGEFLTVLFLNLSYVRIIPREVILLNSSDFMENILGFIAFLLFILVVLSILIYRRLNRIYGSVDYISDVMRRERKGIEYKE